jgi:hypothetical protein
VKQNNQQRDDAQIQNKHGRIKAYLQLIWRGMMLHISLPHLDTFLAPSFGDEIL